MSHPGSPLAQIDHSEGYFSRLLQNTYRGAKGIIRKIVSKFKKESQPIRRPLFQSHPYYAKKRHREVSISRPPTRAKIQNKSAKMQARAQIPYLKNQSHLKRTEREQKGRLQRPKKRREERWKELAIQQMPEMMRQRSRSKQRIGRLKRDLGRGSKENLVAMLYSLTAPEEECESESEEDDFCMEETKMLTQESESEWSEKEEATLMNQRQRSGCK